MPTGHPRNYKLLFYREKQMWRDIEYHIAFKRRCTSRSQAMIPSSPIRKYSLVFLYAVELWNVSSLNLGLEIPPLAVNQCRSQNSLHIQIANHKEPTVAKRLLYQRCPALLLGISASCSGEKNETCLDIHFQSAKAILLKQTSGKNSYLFCCST